MPITGGGGIKAYVSDPNVLAWVQAVGANGGTVSAAREQLMNLTVSALKAYNIFLTLDHLNIFAAENAASARVDLIAQRVATLTGAPTFTADRGYTGVDSSAGTYIDTGLNLSTATNFKRNSGMWHFWSRSASATSAAGFYAMGSTSSGYTSYLTPRYTGDVTFYEVNDNAGNEPGISNTDGTGLWTGWRGNANSQSLYHNQAVLLDTFAVSSAAVANQNVYILNSNTAGGVTANGWGGQCAVAAFGVNQTEAQIAQFYQIMLNHLQAIGAA